MRAIGRIYFDSEPLIKAGWPSRSPTLETVVVLARRFNISLHLPDPVREELAGYWRKRLRAKLDALQSASDRLGRDFRLLQSRVELPHPPTLDDALAHYDEVVEAAIRTCGFRSVSPAIRATMDFFHFADANVAPFGEENDNGIKDMVILLTVIEDVEREPAPSVLITSDKRLTDADIPQLAGRQTFPLRVLSLEALEEELKAMLDQHQQEAWKADRQRAEAAVLAAWEDLFAFLNTESAQVEEALGPFSSVEAIVSTRPTILRDVTTPFPPERPLGESVPITAEIEVDLGYVPTAPWLAFGSVDPNLQPLFGTSRPRAESHRFEVLLVGARAVSAGDCYRDLRFSSIRKGDTPAIWSTFVGSRNVSPPTVLELMKLLFVKWQASTDSRKA